MTLTNSQYMPSQTVVKPVHIPATRMEIQQGNDGLVVSLWQEGWVEGDPPNTTVFKRNVIMFDALKAAETAGWNVQVFRDGNARCLRGEITRIDFMKLGDKFRVDSWPYGWTASTRPIRSEMMTVQQVQELVKSISEQGWAFHSWLELDWRAGARAWKDKPQPVRDEYAIMRLRKQLKAELERGHCNLGYDRDLAMDL